MSITRTCVCFAILTLLPLTIGCGRSLAPGNLPVDVKVIYQGSPVNEAVVIFVGEDGKYANGLTNSSGVAAMGTVAPGDGVSPGIYHVGIDKSQLIEEKDLNDPTGNTILRSETVYHVPPKYGDPINSGLQADIHEGGEALLVFELSDAPSRSSKASKKNKSALGK